MGILLKGVCNTFVTNDGPGSGPDTFPAYEIYLIGKNKEEGKLDQEEMGKSVLKANMGL